MTRIRTGFALFVSALALLLGSAALAQGETHVLLIGRSENDPSVKRIEQELRILGLEVEFLPASKSRGGLADNARRRGATAAAEVRTDPPAVLLWTDPIRFPDVGGGPDLRVDEGSAGTAEPGLLALRAVELLHGRILPVPATVGDASDGGAPDAAPTPPAASTTAPATSDAAPPSRVSAFAGPAVVVSSGLGPSPAAWVGVRFNVVDRVDLELTGAIPIASTTVAALSGSTDARTGTLGLAANFRFFEPRSSLFVSAGLGLGAYISVVGGDAAKAEHAVLGTRGAALPFLRAGAGYWLGDHVAVRGDALLGVALPAPTLQMKGQDLASLGAPTAIFALALEVRP